MFGFVENNLIANIIFFYYKGQFFAKKYIKNYVIGLGRVIYQMKAIGKV